MNRELKTTLKNYPPLKME